MKAKPKTDKDPSCKARWKSHKDSRVSALRDMFERMSSDNDARREEAMQDFSEYGLSFDYVAPETFNDQPEGYWRYQISWGGPSEEFRFYSSSYKHRPYRIEFWFLDWGNGHGRALAGDDLETLLRVWDDFDDMSATESEFRRATDL